MVKGRALCSKVVSKGESIESTIVSTVVAEWKDGITVGDSLMIRPEFCTEGTRW
jgi:hypothetical protein